MPEDMTWQGALVLWAGVSVVMLMIGGLLGLLYDNPGDGLLLGLGMGQVIAVFVGVVIFFNWLYEVVN